jgi:hypothetical protein
VNGWQLWFHTLHVLARPAGVERDKAIHSWCVSVWDAFRENERLVTDLLLSYGKMLGDVSVKA